MRQARKRQAKQEDLVDEFEAKFSSYVKMQNQLGQDQKYLNNKTKFFKKKFDKVKV